MGCHSETPAGRHTLSASCPACHRGTGVRWGRVVKATPSRLNRCLRVRWEGVLWWVEPHGLWVAPESHGSTSYSGEDLKSSHHKASDPGGA